MESHSGWGSSQIMGCPNVGMGIEQFRNFNGQHLRLKYAWATLNSDPNRFCFLPKNLYMPVDSVPRCFALWCSLCTHPPEGGLSMSQMGRFHTGFLLVRWSMSQAHLLSLWINRSGSLLLNFVLPVGLGFGKQSAFYGLLHGYVCDFRVFVCFCYRYVSPENGSQSASYSPLERRRIKRERAPLRGSPLASEWLRKSLWQSVGLAPVATVASPKDIKATLWEPR